MAILSFRDPQLKVFIESGIVPKKSQWQSVRKIVLRKLDMLNYAKDLNDLNRPPGKKLEALKGDLYGYFSIRINDQ
ncbi:MAG: type II toxin-antitoxin system RelE/ParE family toxin, partial [Bacteriovorax sp.]|nr:type II toxin-antitoxin system RelE/ParE family toxin [Bacteriovorax sp.]